MAITPNTPEDIRSVGMVYVLVSEFAAPIILGLVIDWQFGTSPWGLFGGVFFGLVVGGLGIRRLLGQLEAAEKRKKERP